MSKFKASIVIVHWNSPELLDKQLKLVSAFDSTQVIVVNNSPAELLKHISKQYPQVKFVHLPSNRGYSFACNRGFLHARADWVLFLNPDVSISESAVEGLLKYALLNKLDALSPQPDSSNYFKPVPSPLSLFTEFFGLGFLTKLLPSKNTLTGGALLIKKEVLFDIGGWDERFFLWFEDSDLTKRLVDHNYKIAFAPIKVEHAGGKSVQKLSLPFQKQIFFNSMMIYADKHFSFLGKRVTNIIRKKYTSKKILPSLQKGVSLTIPNMKPALLNTFLKENSHFLSLSTELVVVSSGISNSELWNLRGTYPNTRFIFLEKNDGFAKTVNIGMRTSTYDWTGTVNDDVNFNDDWVNQCIGKANLKTGSLNPIIKKISGQIESAGIEILPIAKARPIDKYLHKSVDATNGAAVIYSHKVLEKVGLFDERFGSYLEDIDLSLRIKKAGFENQVIKEASLAHNQGSSSKSNLILKSWQDLNNWWRISFKHFKYVGIQKNIGQFLMERARNISGLIKALLCNKQLWLSKSLLALGIICLFLFLRLYKIQTSLLFFNDIGRDFYVLSKWISTNKPPLLGPQTSALPFNQSAIYFYMLMPLFWITKQSFFSSIYTLLLFYLGFFLIGVKKLWNNKVLFKPFLISAFLISIHPQFIIQNRFVWNPSFLGPIVLAATLIWLQLTKKYSSTKLAFVSALLALAVVLNYSAATIVLGIFIVSLFLFKKKTHILNFGVLLGVFSAVWSFPTIAFELRHNFFLTKLLIYGDKLSQEASAVSSKISSLLLYGMPAFNIAQLVFLGLMVLVGVIISMLQWKSPRSRYLIITFLLFISSLIITLLIPVTIHAHYIFGLLTLLILTISFLPNMVLIPAVIMISILWLKPSIFQGYFSPAYRSVIDSDNCAKAICSQVSKPIFVSVQSDLHPYHDGMEWKYMLHRAGCEVKELDSQIDQASSMVVIVDHSKFVHGETAYNELTQFGSSRQISHQTCQNNLEWLLLEKSTN